MARSKLPEKQVLKYRLETRVNQAKYEELKALVNRTLNMDMSGLLRHILDNRPIKTYTHDRSLDIVMEELAKLRGEIKSIGVNINQVTKQFNTYPEPFKKQFYAKIAMDQFTSTQHKIDQLLNIVSTLSKKWLRE